jgi:hypothetical protein
MLLSLAEIVLCEFAFFRYQKTYFYPDTAMGLNQNSPISPHRTIHTTKTYIKMYEPAITRKAS